MIEQLRQMFPSLILYQDITEHEKDDFEWFMTAKSELIGIHKHELTAKDIHLLSTFLKPYSISALDITPEERAWHTYIRNDNIHDSNSITFRFIHFSFQLNQISPALFKEAVNELFAKQVPVLWENDHEGIIVEENPDEAISFASIIDVFMSDLSVNIHFFVGPFMTSLSEAKKGYQKLVKGADIAGKYSEKSVVTYVEAIPYMLIDQTENDFRADFVRSVLSDTTEDDELLKTIETFITCNLNVSVAAKELYLHRNSLQYRLDKFKERTGIDIRELHQAVTVYLALLATK